MELVRWLGFAAFFVSSAVIGVRLLWLARHTGQLPELLIGVGVLGMGPLGYGLLVLSFAAAGRSALASAALQGCALLALNVGAISQYLVIWRVFRPQEAWARAAFLVATALVVAGYTGMILENGLVYHDTDRLWQSAWYRLGVLMRLGSFAWNSCESLRYYVLMRRRDRLGLGDPVVSNRFLLWGLGAGAAAAGTAVGLGARALAGVGSAHLPFASLLISLHGLVAAVAMWLAFVPPAAYLRRLTNRSRPVRAR